MIKKTGVILLAAVSTLVGLYPIIYFLVDRKFGLLQSKSETVLTNALWNTAFYIHITLGGLALLVGWTQFLTKWRTQHLSFHRKLGKIYVLSVLASALAGIYIAFFATGGTISSAGFMCLGVLWFLTTVKAYLFIRNGQILKHQKMMVYSYAACLAAVTLRIYLPVLVYLFHDFTKAYSLVSWLCWVPNLIIAYYINKNSIPGNKTDTNASIAANGTEPGDISNLPGSAVVRVQAP